MCKSLAIGESLTAHTDSNENLRDLLTKTLFDGKRKYLVLNILHNIYNGEFTQYAVAK